MRQSNYNKQEEQADGIPVYSDTCSKPGCKHETSIAMIKCSSGDGIKLRVGSEVLLNGTAKPWIMKDGYNFICWWTRCAECYEKGMRNYKSKLELQEKGDL